VIVTSKDQETDIMWGKRQGASDYLIKPADEDYLKVTVERLLSEAAEA
jgi:twitching motility two-component system response regulator PilH